MLSALWSSKGGSGTTVTAALLAASLAERHGASLLVDLAGDAMAVAGRAERDLGLTDWLAAGPDAPLEGLARLEADVGGGVRILPRGSAPAWEPSRARAFVTLLAADRRPVVVDLGTLDAPGPSEPLEALRREVLDHADHSLLAIRPCYLALRRAVGGGARATGVVLIREAGRSLDGGDVAQVLGVDVVAEVDHDPMVARLVDAGLLLDRPPRATLRALRRVA